MKTLNSWKKLSKFWIKAKIKYRDHNLHVELSPFVERGDDFKAAGNYAEAILEYQAALKQISGLPKEHRFTRYNFSCNNRLSSQFD